MYKYSAESTLEKEQSFSFGNPEQYWTERSESSAILPASVHKSASPCMHVHRHRTWSKVSFTSAARAVYGSVSRQHTSHGSEVVYVDSRPRYDPGTYDSYCARSRNERSLHDLPLLDRQIADPPVQRSIDREQRSAHTGQRAAI